MTNRNKAEQAEAMKHVAQTLLDYLAEFAEPEDRMCCLVVQLSPELKIVVQASIMGEDSVIEEVVRR